MKAQLLSLATALSVVTGLGAVAVTSARGAGPVDATPAASTASDAPTAFPSDAPAAFPSDVPSAFASAFASAFPSTVPLPTDGPGTPASVTPRRLTDDTVHDPGDAHGRHGGHGRDDGHDRSDGSSDGGTADQGSGDH
ncbi:MAG: hypothetical protein JWN35_2387 [Frankiales bacterium]|nr:hypothetical protein [Frankiales bacterium]